MIFRFSSAAVSAVLICGLCLNLIGCSGSDESSQSESNPDTADQVAHTAAPKLNDIEKAAEADLPDEDRGSRTSDDPYDDDDEEEEEEEDPDSDDANSDDEFGNDQMMDDADLDDDSPMTVAPSLPDDIKLWSDDDYLLAAKEKNEILISAIQNRAAQSVGDPAFAKLMGRILDEAYETLPPPPLVVPDTGGVEIPFNLEDHPHLPKSNVPPGGAFMFPAPAERFRNDQNAGGKKIAAVDRYQLTGLKFNGRFDANPREYRTTSVSLQAYQSAEDSGNLDPEALVHVIVSGLATSNTPEAWRMLQAISTGSRSTPLPTADVKNLVLTTALQASEFDAAVVRSLLDSAVTDAIANPAAHQQTLAILVPAAAETAEHYFKLAKSGDGHHMEKPEMQKPDMDDDEMMESKAGLGMEKSGMSDSHISPKMFPILAEVLWNEKHVTGLAAAISSAGTTQAAGTLIQLAVSLPHDSIRKATFGLLEAEYEAGAQGLQSAGFFTTMLKDPGMLPVLKSLPRRRPPRRSNAASADQPSPAVTWAAGTGQAVMALRDRLRIAADHSELAYSGVAPIRLYRNTTQQKSIRFTTTSNDLKTLGESRPSQTTYHYTSSNATFHRAIDLEKMVEHYEKRAKAFRRPQSDSLLWLDGMKTSSNGSRISMDVIIEHLSDQTEGENAASRQYSVEVIVVEVRDPKFVEAEEPAAAN